MDFQFLNSITPEISYDICKVSHKIKSKLQNLINSKEVDKYGNKILDCLLSHIKTNYEINEIDQVKLNKITDTKFTFLIIMDNNKEETFECIWKSEDNTQAFKITFGRDLYTELMIQVRKINNKDNINSVAQDLMSEILNISGELNLYDIKSIKFLDSLDTSPETEEFEIKFNDGANIIRKVIRI